MPPIDDVAIHARLYELAKVRAHQLRKEAVAAFGHSVTAAVQRGAAASARAIAIPLQALPHNTHTSPKA